MKKKTSSLKVKEAEEKNLFRQTGEVIGSIGAHVVNATNHVVDFVADEMAHAKRAVGQIAKKVKKVSKKRPVKKRLKKITGKAKKLLKKTSVRESDMNSGKAGKTKSGSKTTKKSKGARGKRRTATAKH